MKISRRELARRAGVSAAAVSRFFNEKHGSLSLQQKLNHALDSLNISSASSVAEKLRFPDAGSVKAWLEEMGRSQRWLAQQLEWSPSNISRLLAGKIKWKRDLSRQIESLVIGGMDHAVE